MGVAETAGADPSVGSQRSGRSSQVAALRVGGMGGEGEETREHESGGFSRVPGVSEMRLAEADRPGKARNQVTLESAAAAEEVRESGFQVEGKPRAPRARGQRAALRVPEV